MVILSAAGLLEHDLKVAEIAKARTGGRAVTAVVDNFVAPLFPERLLGDFPYLDIALRGQPEAIIPELARRFPHLDRVAGIAYRDGEVVRSTPQAPPLDNLDSLPFMAYDLLPMERYTISYLAAPRYEVKIPGIMLRTTRDCPYQCAFCVIGSSPWRGYDHHWRGMSPQRVVDEMEHVVRTYGHKGFFFWDETYTLDRERAWAISEEILRRRLRIIWRCLTRIDRVDRDLLRHMARSGCQMIEFGLESGDPQVRYYLNKRFSDDAAIQAVKWAKEAGIRVNCDFIVGMPWETPETLERTRELALALPADGVHITMAFPYPETEFYRITAEEGLLETADIYQLMVHQRVRVGHNAVARTRAMNRDELEVAWTKLRDEVDRYHRRRAFTRPSHWVEYLRACRNPVDLGRLAIKGGRQLAMLVRGG